MAASMGSTAFRISTVLFLAILINVPRIEAQFTPICGVPGYNLANLTARIWQLHVSNSPGTCLQPSSNTSITGCNFYMAFCRTLDKVMFFNCTDASVCQEDTPALAGVYKLGSYVPNPFKVDTTYNKNGFIVDFPQGDTYERPNGTSCTLSIRLDFICKSDAVWEIPQSETTLVTVPGPAPVLFNLSTCQYEILLNYAGACKMEVPLPSNLLSAGSILVIIFFVALSAYCLFGTAFKCIQGARGKEAVPNNGFWMDLPVFVSDGIVFILNGCKPAKKSYDSI